MNQLVPTLSRTTMTSIELVEFINSQRVEDAPVLAHSDFLKKVTQVLGEEVAGNFSCYYKASNGKQNPMYRFPKREACLMAMSYSYDLQAKVFDRMTAMECAPQFAIPTTLSAALRLAADQADTIASQNEKIGVMEVAKLADAPKVEFAMAIRNLDGTCEIGQFASVIGLGRNTLFKKMREDGFLMKGNRPYQKYKDRGFLTEVEGEPIIDAKGKSHPDFQTRVTGAGQVFFERKYRTSGAQKKLC